MHDDIKHFLLTGEISDSNLVQSKTRLVEAIEGTMRDEGFAPVLDMDPQWTLSYIPKSEKYTFALTVYGTYVGKDESWSTGGVMGGKKIPKYSPLTK
jgi:hypothetical protein